MFMWMFIEGLYLHNMVTVAVFQGSFPIVFFSLLGWGVPVVMTTVWVHCTALFMDTSPGDCMWNYNLTPYYWILEGPRLTVILVSKYLTCNSQPRPFQHSTLTRSQNSGHLHSKFTKFASII